MTKDYILRILRQRQNLDADDASYDAQFATYTPNEIFSEVLHWNGLLGMSYTIQQWVRDIYGIELDNLDTLPSAELTSAVLLFLYRFRPDRRCIWDADLEQFCGYKQISNGCRFQQSVESLPYSESKCLQFQMSVFENGVETKAIVACNGDIVIKGDKSDFVRLTKKYLDWGKSGDN